MLFLYELKKILKRISPMVIIVFIAATALLSIILTASFFNTKPGLIDNSNEYIELSNTINNWDSSLPTDISNSFDIFYIEYEEMNASVYKNDRTKIVTHYENAKQKFNDFYFTEYNPNKDHLLIPTTTLDMETVLEKLNTFLTGTKDADQIIDALTINKEWSSDSFKNTLSNLATPILKTEEITEIKNILSQPYSKERYDLAFHTYALGISQNSTFEGDLSNYKGFENFISTQDSTDQIAIASYILDNNLSGNYSTAFIFGNIYNNQQDISLFDFMFTNLEMITIPLILLVIILSTCVFFTDLQQRTAITLLITKRKRTGIVFSKILAVVTISLLSLLLYSGLFAISGALFFGASTSPNLLFISAGSVTEMTSINYFTVYFLSLLFKTLAFLLIAGLLSMSKNNPKIIVSLTFVISAVIIICNALLGGFDFYQYIPFFGLDPIKFFGTQMLLSPTPSSFNILYSFIPMAAIVVFLFTLLVYKFKRREF